jgi:hypothetical protein
MPISKWGVLNPFNVDHSLPVLRAQSINGYYLFHPVAMRRQMNKSGSLSARERADLAAALAAQFPAAVPSSRDNSSSGLQLLKPPVRREAGSGPVRIEHENAAGWSGRTKAEKEQYRLAKEADHEREWEKQRSKVEAAFGQPVPLFLLQRLPADGRLWCHPALWHCRVYWRCIHGKVGTHFNYRQAGAVAATCHEGGTMRTLQWSALTGLLEHLREQGYISFDESLDGRIEEDILVLADLNNPPLRV